MLPIINKFALLAGLLVATCAGSCARPVEASPGGSPIRRTSSTGRRMSYSRTYSAIRVTRSSGARRSPAIHSAAPKTHTITSGRNHYINPAKPQTR